MPRPRKAPRLFVRRDEDPPVWVIRDGSRQVRTGCIESEAEEAEKRLAEYLASKHEPTKSSDPKDVPVADVLSLYLTDKIPHLGKPGNEIDFITQLSPFWGKLHLYDIDNRHTTDYAKARMKAGVKASTARRELETLRAAANYFVNDRKIPFRPVVTLPPKAEPRLRWLTRSEAARFIHAARRRGNHHLARLILIGVYTGTRTGAIIALKWVEATHSGYVDIDAGVLYRKGASERTTAKRRPSVRIPSRLLPHLKRWKAMDKGVAHVINRDGQPVKSVRKAWANSRADASLDAEVIPHSLRHTAASWGIQNVRTTQELQTLADFLGMSLEMLLKTYGHLNPDHQSAAADAISRRPGA
ncbi:site-specific integrase [Roseibium sp. RKSG952]|uniref:tyrosine-type recombinase/integrase n=1 Tax=Roseibium sp. RKSG952 TaxID=2529384 RepID=UPI0012BB59EB|nr:site-specific integrase [Roseibium sp. RKSG952]MTH95109.1 site-specific integrase [Roseibium sp. RKSG952]